MRSTHTMPKSMQYKQILTAACTHLSLRLHCRRAPATVAPLMPLRCIVLVPSSNSQCLAVVAGIASTDASPVLCQRRRDCCLLALPFKPCSEAVHSGTSTKSAHLVASPSGAASIVLPACTHMSKHTVSSMNIDIKQTAVC
jgi:hypothetical protein